MSLVGWRQPVDLRHSPSWPRVSRAVYDFRSKSPKRRQGQTPIGRGSFKRSGSRQRLSWLSRGIRASIASTWRRPSTSPRSSATMLSRFLSTRRWSRSAFSSRTSSGCGPLQFLVASRATLESVAMSPTTTSRGPNSPSPRRRPMAMGAKDVLAVRSSFAEETLADLYDPLTMPRQLRDAHDGLDRAVAKVLVFVPMPLMPQSCRSSSRTTSPLPLVLYFPPRRERLVGGRRDGRGGGEGGVCEWLAGATGQ